MAVHKLGLPIGFDGPKASTRTSGATPLQQVY